MLHTLKTPKGFVVVVVDRRYDAGAKGPAAAMGDQELLNIRRRHGTLIGGYESLTFHVGGPTRQAAGAGKANAVGYDNNSSRSGPCMDR